MEDVVADVAVGGDSSSKKEKGKKGKGNKKKNGKKWGGRKGRKNEELVLPKEIILCPICSR